MLATAILAFIALIYLVLAVRDYVRNGRRLTLRAKIHLRLVLIFTVVIVYLLLTR